jgi:uncharacterized membrane protein YdbT with pleckstrin-like domain
MSYIQNNLLKKEKLVYFSHMHWVIFVFPVIMLVTTIIFSAFAPLLFPGFLPFYKIRLASLVILICLLTTIFSGFAAFVRYATSEYGITNRRLVIKTGWLSRDTVDLSINRIEAIYVDQSILGRILNYGTIRIIGTGGTQDPFFYIPRPMRFRNLAQEQIDAES